MRRRHRAHSAVAVVAVALAACAGGPTTSSSPPPVAGASIPAEWPEAVPLSQQGELYAAYVTGDSVVGSWQVATTDERAVLADYESLLEAAGFDRSKWYSKNATSGFVYTGHGLEVAVQASPVEDQTSLDVGITCVRRCEDWPAAP